MLNLSTISIPRLPRLVGALAIVLLTLLVPTVHAQTSNVVAWGDDQFGQLGDGYAPYLPHQTQNLTDVMQIAAGWYHTAALKPDGTVWTWGNNTYGQLGDGTTTNRSVPTPTLGAGGTGFLTGVQAIATGYTHTAALKQDGTVWAWGDNFYGQLGDGTMVQRTAPVQVKGLNGTGVLMGVTALAAGYTYTVALKSDGTVWAWGHNQYGELGDGTTTQRTKPVQVKGAGGTGVLTGIVALSAGSSHTTALKSDGTVWTWGDNSFGQLGDGTTTQRTTPVQVKGPNGTGFLTGVQAIVAGQFHTAALKADGTVWAWGQNTFGDLGDGTTTQRTTPVQVKGAGGTGVLMGITAIAAGNAYTVALKQDGTVWTWGDNQAGEIGDGTAVNRSVPVPLVGPNGVDALTGVQAIAAGSYHAATLKQDGTVWEWGDNTYGQLGDGRTTAAATAALALTTAPVTAVAAGNAYTVALKQDGTVWAWGDNQSGELGDGTTTNRSMPVQVAGVNGAGVLTNITAVAAGQYHSVALKSDGTVWAWGYNGAGELGDGTFNNRLTPVQVVGPNGVGFLTGIVALAAGQYHTVALKSDGTVWTWGYNSNGQLGDGTTTNRGTPVQVAGANGVGSLTGVQAIAAGGNYTVVLKSDGTVWTWGSNGYGQLGNGTTTQQNMPVQVLGPNSVGYLTGITAIAAGYSHTVALKSDGTIWTWGQNFLGALGDGTTTNRMTPAQVLGANGVGVLTGVQAIAAGSNYTIALKQDGTVWGWGYNNYGVLGDGTIKQRNTPVQALGVGGVGYLTGVQKIAAGFEHTVALLTPNAAVSGAVTLQGCTVPQQSVTFTFRPTDGSAPLTRMQTLAADGSFSFNDIPRGKYNMAVKGAVWLQKVVAVDTTSSNVSGVAVTLPAGDANNDNLIDLADFGVLVNAFGSSRSDPTSGYDPNADFNCDGVVDVGDFGLLVNNYGDMGDP